MKLYLTNLSATFYLSFSIIITGNKTLTYNKKIKHSIKIKNNLLLFSY